MSSILQECPIILTTLIGTPKYTLFKKYDVYFKKNFLKIISLDGNHFKIVLKTLTYNLKSARNIYGGS